MSHGLYGWKDETAGEPGFRVEGCVHVPPTVKASPQRPVSALKPWSRNGNMRPRVTATWTRTAPIR